MRLFIAFLYAAVSAVSLPVMFGEARAKGDTQAHTSVSHVDISGASPWLLAHPAATDTTASDTSETQTSWLVLPFLAYAPETKISTGGVVGYYREPPGRRPSSVQTTLTVTQRRQIILQITPEVFWRGGTRTAGEVSLSSFPDTFYGVGGDTPESVAEDFTSRYLALRATHQVEVVPNLRVGPRVVARWETVTETEDGGVLGTGAMPGSDESLTTGLGAAALWDARDNLYYPRDGSYAEVAGLWHSALVGSDFTFGRFTADFRGYRSAGGVVMAAQVYAEAVAGTPSFQMLPQLGGSNLMRGYVEGRYRAAVYWTAQAEVRVPLFWRFKAVAFAGAGEVAPRLGPDLVRGVQGSVGLGGRLRLNDSGVHGRIDLAYGAGGPELYVSLLEAF